MTFTDWATLGILPLQDHDPDALVSLRSMLVGGRIRRMATPEHTNDASNSLIEYDRQDDMGTLGDVHPWMFWQTKDRNARGMGSWAQVFGAVCTDASGGVVTQGSGTTGSGSDAALLPIRGRDYNGDGRYAIHAPTWPKNFPLPVKGQLMIAGGMTEESTQREWQMTGDPRLWAPAVIGPGECGTLVCDLQPSREACMDKTDEPGRGGRHARLQSIFRVIAFNPRGDELSAGNGIALNYGTSLEGIAGYGMIFGDLLAGSSDPTTPTGPTTPGAGGGIVRDETASPLAGGTDTLSPAADEARYNRKGVNETGKFRPISGNGGVGLMSATMFGPIVVGCSDDKHTVWEDRDGNPVTSAHISTNAYFLKDSDKDGPLYFEGDYPHPPGMPLSSRVHLAYDGATTHRFLNDTRQGVWRWWCEVPYIVPQGGGGGGGGGPPTPGQPPWGPTTGGPPWPGGPGGGPGTPGVPAGPGAPRGGSGPGTGQPGAPRAPGRPGNAPGPVTGGGGWGTPRMPALPRDPTGYNRNMPRGQWPSGWDTPGTDMPGGGSQQRVGGTSSNDRALFTIHHPFYESFSAIAFRPQLLVAGLPSYEHNPGATSEELRAEEQSRPQVLALRSWGAQKGDGWGYTVRPDESRARGGTASGGVLLCPPEFQPEDYLGINSNANTDSPATTSYLAGAPGVGFALGTPNVDGGLAAKAFTLTRSGETTTFAALDSSRASTALMTMQLVQSGGAVKVAVGGTAGLRIPVGTTAQRWASPAGGEVRVNSSLTPDALEYYNAPQAAWKRILDENDIAATVHPYSTFLADLDTAAVITDGVPYFKGYSVSIADVSAAAAGDVLTTDGVNAVWDHPAIRLLSSEAGAPVRTICKSSTAEATLCSFTVPANTLGSTGKVTLEIHGDLFVNSANTFTLKIKFGGTTYYQKSSAFTASAVRRPILWRIHLSAKNATNAQALIGEMAMGYAFTATTGVGDWGEFNGRHATVANDCAIDSTAAQTLAVTLTSDVSSANIYARVYSAKLIAYS